MVDYPYQYWGGQSHAQHGDDYAFLNIFHRLQIERPSYIDIGAHHPFELSNTARLYSYGSRGVNVEAKPDQLKLFHKMRPEDVNIHAAVVVDKNVTTVDLYCIDAGSGISSTIPEALNDYGGVNKTITVPAMTIEKVVARAPGGQWPDLLSIDIEGNDLDVLSSIDWSVWPNKPKVICVEAVSPISGDISDPLRTLLGDAYFVHSWAGVNMLFVLREYEARLR